ncbi:PAS domain-containing protein [Bowmanella sp. JS7-9]|uniref:PAS domain-containing protein n=1 Tax=Pseudobowmanella zhangzhouensis TaxID=1537679 RepID=A0ABW1XHR0_9ALTE|nr:PAS domain-containing protein [Bowmanella sp. JS7-9]TBX25759.1 diguanylate cyclase [Bowmanella sp. JS7-9]
MNEEMQEFHWMMTLLQNVDVGLVVLNRDYQVKVWNGFMESHSGLLPSHVRDKSIFELFPEINEDWFRRKCWPVFDLKSRAFIVWEQTTYLIRFPNYRPITGSEEVMYQNIVLSPIVSPTGEVDAICMMIYDVTDVAAGKKALESAQVALNETLELQE